MASPDRMWRLAASFPTLQTFVERQPGPFDVERLLQALSEPWVTTGSRFALLFVLDVWNPAIRSELPENLRARVVEAAFLSVIGSVQARWASSIHISSIARSQAHASI